MNPLSALPRAEYNDEAEKCAQVSPFLYKRRVPKVLFECSPVVQALLEGPAASVQPSAHMQPFFFSRARFE